MTKEPYLRLKDLENVSSETVDFKIIVDEVLKYKKKWIFNSIFYKKASIKSLDLVVEARKVDPTKVKISKNSGIKFPKSIDSVSFMAMMELQSVMGSYNGTDNFGEYIAKIITKACYGSEFEDDYSSNNENYNSLFHKVLSEPIWEMVGLYNWIEEQLVSSQKAWSERFFSVEVQDKDYEMAGGNRMSQFNVNRTLKMICKDYNIPLKEAWQVSYAMTQTNSYEAASANYTQDQMRIIKEAKYKAGREQ